MENSRIGQIINFLKDDPEDAFLNYALAVEYVGMNRLSDAKERFEFLLMQHPGYTATYYQLGKLLQKENNRGEAEKIFRTGIEKAVLKKELHTAAELRTALNELLYDEDE